MNEIYDNYDISGLDRMFKSIEEKHHGYEDSKHSHAHISQLRSVPNDSFKLPEYVIFDKTEELNKYTFRVAGELTNISFFNRVFRYKKTVAKIMEVDK